MRQLYMPFCEKYITYTPCVPADQSLPPDAEFPEGRWSNHTARNKDEWIRKMIQGNIHWRVYLELMTMDGRLKDKGPLNEYEKRTEIIPRFHQSVSSSDCKEAYRRFMCWMNFPRCDDNGNSLIMCRSACENFFKSCKYEEDLWRCGRSDYVTNETVMTKNRTHYKGGFYTTEKSQWPNGSLKTRDVSYYKQGFFPGEPFTGVGPCTPGYNGSRGLTPNTLLWFFLGLFAAWTVMVSM